MTSSMVNKNRTPTRARGERVYKPGGKKEWRVVFWTHESTKPSRRQCSFSEAKYGKEAASLLSRAVLDYIDVKGVVPDDLHDPPILDPAKKELIEYYSALHESRKASQKKTRPRGHSNKGSSEPSIVPLYTLAGSKPPSVVNGLSVSPQTTGSIIKSGKLIDMGNPTVGNLPISASSESPDQAHIHNHSPLSIITSTGEPDKSGETLAKSEFGKEGFSGDIIKGARGSYSVHIPPIPNIESSNFGGIEFNQPMSFFDSEGQTSKCKAAAPPTLQKQDSLHTDVSQMAVFSSSVFPAHHYPSIQSQSIASQHVSSGQSPIFPDPSSIAGCGLMGPDVQNMLSHASHQLALQSQLNLLNHLGYLQHMACFTVSGACANSLASPPATFISNSFLQSFPLLFGLDANGYNVSSQMEKSTGTTTTQGATAANGLAEVGRSGNTKVGDASTTPPSTIS